LEPTEACEAFIDRGPLNDNIIHENQAKNQRKGAKTHQDMTLHLIPRLVPKSCVRETVEAREVLVDRGPLNDNIIHENQAKNQRKGAKTHRDTKLHLISWLVPKSCVGETVDAREVLVDMGPLNDNIIHENQAKNQRKGAKTH
jgi:hypothetical protein